MTFDIAQLSPISALASLANADCSAERDFLSFTRMAAQTAFGPLVAKNLNGGDLAASLHFNSGRVLIDAYPQVRMLQLSDGRTIEGSALTVIDGVIQPSPHYNGCREVLRQELVGATPEQIQRFFQLVTGFARNTLPAPDTVESFGCHPLNQSIWAGSLRTVC